jgi:hypothetical protein
MLISLCLIWLRGARSGAGSGTAEVFFLFSLRSFRLFGGLLLAALSHHIHGTGSMANYRLGHAAEEPLLESSVAMGTYNDEICAPFFSFLNDERLGIAPPNPGLCEHTRGAKPVGKACR